MGVNGSASGMILDLMGTLDRFGGDKELFCEMSAMLLEDLPPLFSRLKSSVVAKDATSVRSDAHALKGLVSGCGGVRAAQVAQQLENAGHDGDLSQAPELVETLDSELGLLTKALRECKV